MIDAPTGKAVAVSLRIGCPFFGTELVFASGTAISPRYSASNPLLHPTFEERLVWEICG
jgi:hypothetical protein